MTATATRGDAAVERVAARAFTVPTDSPESDGTLAWDSTTLVYVEAAGGGETGIGYTYGDVSVATFVESKLVDTVAGADALAPQAAWERMQHAIRNAGRPGVGAMAVSAVDVALWDLKAKLLGVALADLLGRFHDEVAIYGSGGFTSYDDRRLTDQLQHRAHEQGIPRVKMKVGREPARDPHRLRVAREAIGDDVELLVDANGAFTPKQALYWAHRYADHGVTYLEEPVTSEDRAGLRRVRDHGPPGMAIAAGEYEWDLPQLAELAGCVDILQADVTRCGGVTTMLRAHAVCKARALPFSAHCAPAISAHVCAAMERARHVEYFHDHVRVERLLFDGTLDPRGGSLRPDRDRPGLGLTLREHEADTHFSYPEDGGSFAHAALRCVGAGKCREDAGTMCPSYMATREEMHTTRGRARILYEMLEGDVVRDGFRYEVHEALDLCLSCKGCKGDCPVSVDMATYKAEFLSKYYKRRLRPPAAYTMGLIMLHARVASRVPRLANFLTHAPGISRLVKRVGGISPRRDMPSFARQTFTDWFAARGEVNPHGEPVLLFPDTFNNFLHPWVLQAGTRALEAAGLRPVVPERQLCCGRPLYDYGMLDTANLFWRRMLSTLEPHIREGVPVVGMEPSCVASFRDELPNLMPHDEDAKRLSLQTLTLAELLERHAGDWEPPRLNRRAVLHGHCHQKATMGMGAERSLYERMGMEVAQLDSGCCGLAGSFGFEADHDDLSRQIGEHKLMPMVRDTPEDTLLLADGFSCKTQIEQMTGRRALHTAELLDMALGGGSSARSRGP